MQLAFAPLYLRLLGAEGFGLIGIWVTLVGISLALDLGLGAAINREMARLRLPDDRGRARDLLRTLEWIYWPLGTVFTVVLFVSAPWLATNWFQVDALPPERMRDSLALIALALGLQWPYNLYAGGLLGLQMHVRLNVVVVVIATMRGVGGAGVLWLASATPEAFFAWQCLCSALQTVLGGGALWHTLRGGAAARWARSLLGDVHAFAAGVTGITLLAMVVTQLDKIAVSRLLPFDAFGYYTFAWLGAALLLRIVGPVFSTVYPRLSELVSRGDAAGEEETYFAGTRLLLLLTLPPAAVAVLFARYILHVWTGDLAVAAQASPAFALLVVGTALNGLLHIPYALQLAHGWTRLALHINLVSAVFALPLLVRLIGSYGIAGAAGFWMLLNLAYVVVGAVLMHRRLLRGRLGHWAGRVVAFPAACCIGAVLPFTLLLPRDASATGVVVVTTLAWVAGSGAFYVAAYGRLPVLPRFTPADVR